MFVTKKLYTQQKSKKKKINIKSIRNEAIFCGLMYKTRAKCEMRLVEEISIPFDEKKTELESFTKSVYKMLEIDECNIF